MAKTMDDAFIPECTPEGDYSDVQCFEHEGFAKQCWCVTKDGQEMKGTRASDGEIPDCKAAGVNREAKKLEQQQDQKLKPPQLENPPKATEVEVEVMVNNTEPGTTLTQFALCSLQMQENWNESKLHKAKVETHSCGKSQRRKQKSI